MIQRAPFAVLVASLAIAAGFAACSKTPEPAPSTDRAPASPTSNAATASATIGTHASPPPGAAAPQPGDIGWDAPKAWTSAPNPNPMRKATYKVPKAGGDPEDAELAVSTAGGGVGMNVDRWATQFGGVKPQTELRTVNGLKVTVVEIKGTFAGTSMMGPAQNPKPNQMLLGAIVDTGDTLHFFKMVGGEKTVLAARKDFDAFVASFRAK